MYTYLLNLTFYAGSDAPEDTDRDLFIMKTSEMYSKEQIEDVFQKVNSLLGSYDENENFPYSYEEGINSDTLTKGVGYYTHSEIEKADDFSGHIDGIYTIEQWQ